VRPSWIRRFGWWMEYSGDTKLVIGVVAVAVLVLGGVLAARAVAHSSPASAGTALRVITIRRTVREPGRGVRLDAQQRTVTQAIHTPGGVRLTTRPVTRERTVDHTSTQLLTVTRQETVTQPVTDVTTRTVVETKTVTVPPPPPSPPPPPPHP
jgi:hypothetical protein